MNISDLMVHALNCKIRRALNRIQLKAANEQTNSGLDFHASRRFRILYLRIADIFIGAGISDTNIEFQSEVAGRATNPGRSIDRIKICQCCSSSPPRFCLMITVAREIITRTTRSR
jgi:hypothetical protein